MKKNTLIYILGIIILLMMLLGAIFRVVTPNPVPNEATLTSNQLTNTNKTIDVIETSFVEPELPPELASLSISTNRNSIEQVLLNAFNLQQTDPSEEFWQSTTNQNLTMNLVNNYYLLSNDSLEGNEPLEGRIFSSNKNAAIQTVQEILNQLTINLDVNEPVAARISNGGIDYQSNQPNIWEFKLSQSYQGVPLIFNDSTTQPIEIQTWLDGTLKEIKVAGLPVTIQPNTIYNRISIETAVDQIKNNKALFIQESSGIPFDSFEVSNYSSVNFTSVSLEYRQRTDTNIAIPYYKFSGTGVPKDSSQESDGVERTMSVSIITPAIETR